MPSKTTKPNSPNRQPTLTITIKYLTLFLKEKTNEQKTYGPKETLYYVHYIGTDRRLDEWIGKSRFVQELVTPNTVQSTHFNNFGKSFMTRSQRRLNEDFLHMPKSYEDMDAYTRKLEMEHEQVGWIRKSE